MATFALASFVPNGALAQPTPAATDATNIVLAGAVNLDEVMLRAVVATATTSITVKAGDNPPALAAGQGDLVVAAAVGTHLIGPFTSARFAQSDGTLNVNVATPANVTLTALHLPRTA